MPEGYRSRLVTLPETIWKRLDDEAKAEKRNGCSKQLEVILEERYGLAPNGHGASMKPLGTKRTRAAL